MTNEHVKRAQPPSVKGWQGGDAFHTCEVTESRALGQPRCLRWGALTREADSLLMMCTNGMARLKVRFSQIKRDRSAQWSQTLQCWHATGKPACVCSSFSNVCHSSPVIKMSFSMEGREVIVSLDSADRGSSGVQETSSHILVKETLPEEPVHYDFKHVTWKGRAMPSRKRSGSHSCEGWRGTQEVCHTAQLFLSCTDSQESWCMC